MKIPNANLSSPIEKKKKQKTKLQLKAPTQQRSKQTVSIILQACSKLLVEESFFGVTTDKVAKEAGVSIGSLYQFFGNKESVVSAVIRQLMSDDLHKFKTSMVNIDSLSQQKKINLITKTLIDIYSSSVELRAKIQSIQNYLIDRQFYQDHMQSYREIIERTLSPMTGRNSKNVSFVITNALIGLLNNFFEHNSRFHEDENLVEEIERLFSHYIET